MSRVFIIFYLLSIVSWLYPETCQLNIHLKNGTCITYRLEDIRKIDFTNVVSAQDVKKFTEIVQSFKLRQNYPNPFNPKTTIEYEIPKAGKVEIEIYDITGRLVRTIENLNHSPGTYQVVWDGLTDSGNKVASGLYLYSVTYQNTVQTRKMILMK